MDSMLKLPPLQVYNKKFAAIVGRERGWALCSSASLLNRTFPSIASSPLNPGERKLRDSPTGWLFDSHVLWKEPYPLLALIGGKYAANAARHMRDEFPPLAT